MAIFLRYSGLTNIIFSSTKHWFVLICALVMVSITNAQEIRVIDNKGTLKTVNNNTVTFLQNGAPQPTNPVPLEGDELFYTDTGLAGGIVSQSFIYDGNTWVLRPHRNAVPLWISNTNGGSYLTNDVINHNGTLHRNLTGTNTDTTPDVDALNWQPAQAPNPPIVAYGKVNSNGIALRITGATVTRTNTGQYTVTLNNARTTANYIIQLSVLQSVNNRDDINTSITGQTTTAFTVAVHEGDNGTGADTYRDRVWHFTVIDF
jgi:hypothetical protein